MDRGGRGETPKAERTAKVWREALASAGGPGVSVCLHPGMSLWSRDQGPGPVPRVSTASAEVRPEAGALGSCRFTEGGPGGWMTAGIQVHTVLRAQGGLL